MAKKRAKGKKASKNQKSQKGGNQIIIIVGALMAAIMFSSTVLLLIGMLPTLAALFADRSKRKSRTITIGAMNLAACSPFLFQLWVFGNSFEKAVEIIVAFWPIIVMYVGAAIGYMINWSIAGIVSSVLFQRGKGRQKAIVKQQEELIERWGKEVTGELPLDERGFAIPSAVPPPADQKAKK